MDAAPFAGVFFLLVIFLLLHSSLVFMPGVPIQLPEARGLAGTDSASLAVAVDSNGQLYFENQLISKDRLKGRLQSAVSQARQPLALVIQADKRVVAEQLTELWLLARDAGIREIIQATRPPLVPSAAVRPKT